MVKNATITWRARWSGLLPPEIKDQIHKHSKTFDDKLYLLAEPTSWEFKEEKMPKPPRPVYKDPLLVGYAHGSLWLIDQFDVTPLERYVVSEFSTKA